MKGMLYFLIVVMMALWILQVSGAAEMVSYKTKEAIVDVERVRFEWHPERIVPYLKAVPTQLTAILRKKISRVLERKRSLSRKKKASREDPEEAFELIPLKNGSFVFGRILEEKDGMVWVKIKGGKIAFTREELGTPEP